jgi:hypothetical protein
VETGAAEDVQIELGVTGRKTEEEKGAAYAYYMCDISGNT